VDKEFLQECLAKGMSLEAIGELAGKHESTVGYWLKKHGLLAVNRDRHAPRGGIDKARLEELVEQGATVRTIAAVLGFSEGAVSHWLRKYGLTTRAGERRRVGRAAKESGQPIVKMSCRHHGLTDFWLEGRGIYRCLKCRSARVSARRRRMKALLVEDAGGRCRLCGYDRYVGALHFHHRDPQQKSFAMSGQGITRSLAKARVEAQKCILLCSNCHAEVEAGIVSV
jgi:transposase